MKSPTSPWFSLANKTNRLFLLTLVSLVAVAALLSLAASASKAKRTAKASADANAAQQVNKTKSDIKVSSSSGQQRLAPNAASITATLTDNVAPATKVAPGGTINYTAAISNTNLGPADDAGSVVYNGNLDLNTTISGLVQVSPVTLNDTYPQTVIGNVSVNSANIPYSVVTNDYVGQNGGAVTITAFDATSTAGGQIVMTTSGVDMGKFTYNPPPGFEGNDTFTYTFTNSVGSSIGTVTIPVSGMVWFINNNAAACTTLAGGCGRLSNPFSTLAAFQALNNGTGNNPAVNDNIFVFESATTYTGGVTLLGGQKFIGQDATDTLSTLTGLTPQSGSAAFPIMNTGAPATTITNAGGAGITLNNTTTSNVIRGLTVSNTSAAKISGTNFGTLTVGKSGSPDVTLSGTGQALNLTTGSFAATSAFTSVAATSSTTTGMSMTSVGGTVAFGSTTTSSTTNQGIFVTTSAVNINFGNTSVTTSGGTGVNLTTNTGTLTFGSLAITPNSGQRGLHATSNTAAITVASGTITTTNHTAVEIQGANSGSKTPINIQLQTVNTTGGGVAPNGIVLRFISSTGAPGSFNVLGTGGTCTFTTPTCTGGRITNTSGVDNTTNGIGVYMEDVAAVSLTRMHIDIHPNDAIRGKTLTGFTLQTSVVDGNNGTSSNAAVDADQNEGGEDSVRLTNLTGSGLIDSCVIAGGFVNNLRVQNNTGTLNRLTVSNSFIGDPDAIGAGQRGLGPSGSGASDVHIVARDGITAMNVTLLNNTLNFGSSTVVSIINNDNANPVGSVDAVLRGNTMVNAQPFASQVGGANVIQISGLGHMTYEIACNKIANSLGINTLIFKGHNLAGTPSANFSGTIFNNTIGLTGVPGSGGGGAGAGIATSASAVNIDQQGTGTGTVLIKNNTIRRYSEAGIRINNIDNLSSLSTLNATVIGNLVTEPDIANGASPGFAGVYVNGGADPATDGASVTNLKLGSTTAAEKNNLSDSNANTFGVYLEKVGTHTFNLSRAGSVAATREQVIRDDNIVDPPAGELFINAAVTLVNTTPTLPAAINETCTPPLIPNPVDNSARDLREVLDLPVTASASTLPVIAKPQAAPAVEAPVSATAMKQAAAPVGNSPAIAIAAPSKKNDRVEALSHHARFKRSQSVKATAVDQQPLAPLSGEAVGPINIGTLPAGKSVTIKYAATVNTTTLTARQASHQGSVTFTNGAGSPKLTDDLDLGGASDPTVTLLDTTLTWIGTGTTPTDWNDPTNWTRPGPLASSYAPGVSNPAVNDVVIPNVGGQPTIGTTDIGIFSLNIANGRTLTIGAGRTLTIGSALPGVGGDLTLDGIISGGALNFGTGSHNINNAGGTGSLSSTNVATVLSGSTVTLNNNLQAGALAVNAGGSMTIATRTLSLNGTGGLVVPGGATFTTTGSTVIFNGTAAQQAAGIAYNNLTINNTAAGAPNALGATLAGNATVNGVLALTSNDLNTSTFTLTQPNTTASTGAGDVVGTVIRSGGPFAAAVPLTFGNPDNRITFSAAGTRPTSVTVTMAKAAPATYAAAVQRNYNISQAGGVGFSATLRLHYLDSELNGNSETPDVNFNLRKGPSWSAVVPTARNVAGTTDSWLENNAVTSFSQWTFAALAPTAAGGSVTGRIVDDNGNPVEGAVVRLNGTQNRKFITDANGFYRFDNVATNGFYTVTPSRANFSFTPSVRSFSQIGESTEAAFGATIVDDGFENPLDTPEYFVRQHYVDFLNREPDEAGFNFWSDQIIECSTDQNCFERRRENVSAAFFLSIEFQRTGAVVDGVYRSAYGVRPDFAHFLPDTRAVGLGVQVGKDGWEALLATNTEAFVNSFVNRAEFHAAYDNLSNADYVDTLISHTGVSFTSAERDALLSGLGTGSMTRAEALRSIAENSRFVSAKFNETFVMMEYFGYLRRDADASGFAFWLNKLNEFNGNFEQAEMVKAFIVSGEFRDRFPR